MGDFKHKTKIEIRYVDMDTFGHVNNANYLTYLEQARIAYFDEVMGWDYDWSKEGVIVARCELDYIKPIAFKDEVFIYTKCIRIGNKSFDVAYQIYKKTPDGDEVLMADAITVMVAYDYVNRKTIEVPEVWKNEIREYEGTIEV